MTDRVLLRGVDGTTAASMGAGELGYLNGTNTLILGGINGAPAPVDIAAASLAAETSARQNADTAETAARTAADTAETTARTTADTTENTRALAAEALLFPRTGGALTGPFATPSYTVATLPAAPPSGSRAFVTDALAPSFNAVVAGSGAVGVPVFYFGGAWRVG